jgi:hypothetical protein
MTRLTVTLTDEATEGLRKLAETEHVHPWDLAQAIIRAELERRGLVPPTHGREVMVPMWLRRSTWELLRIAHLDLADQGRRTIGETIDYLAERQIAGTELALARRAVEQELNPPKPKPPMPAPQSIPIGGRDE